MSRVFNKGLRAVNARAHALIFVMCWASLLTTCFVGCSKASNSAIESTQRSGKPIVYTVNYPLAFFAKRIGGDSIEVVCPVPEGVDPIHWTPNADAIANFQSADLILLNGAGYAKWTDYATLPSSRIAITTREVTDQYIEVPDAITHSHGPDDQHSHAGLAVETWLDSRLAIGQASVIRDELEKLLPDSTSELQANFDSLRSELEDLDAEIESLFAAAPKTWLASHPVYDYLARRYSIDLESLHWEPDELPTEDQCLEFEKLLSEHPASLMLWEDQPLEQTTSRLAELGVKVVTFRPLAGKPDSGDYLSGMRENLNNLTEATAD
jgi:zinc transport system substrate-binding protein